MILRFLNQAWAFLDACGNFVTGMNKIQWIMFALAALAVGALCMRGMSARLSP